MSNRKIGTSFEKDLSERLAMNGFWTHRLAQNTQGQPFDIIATRNGRSYPIDCKVCSKDIFKMERIEENQASSMFYWRETGNGESWFALRMTDSEIYFISFSELERLSLLKTVLSASEIRQYGIPFEEWVGQCE